MKIIPTLGPHPFWTKFFATLATQTEHVIWYLPIGDAFNAYRCGLTTLKVCHEPSFIFHNHTIQVEDIYNNVTDQEVVDNNLQCTVVDLCQPVEVQDQDAAPPSRSMKPRQVV